MQNFEFTKEELAKIDAIIARYPNPQPAVMPVLWMAQEKYGHVEPDVQKTCSTHTQPSRSPCSRSSHLLHTVLQRAARASMFWMCVQVSAARPAVATKHCIIWKIKLGIKGRRNYPGRYVFNSKCGVSRGLRLCADDADYQRCIRESSHT